MQQIAQKSCHHVDGSSYEEDPADMMRRLVHDPYYAITKTEADSEEDPADMMRRLVHDPYYAISQLI
jgi:hypothetical protein